MIAWGERDDNQLLGVRKAIAKSFFETDKCAKNSMKMKYRVKGRRIFWRFGPRGGPSAAFASLPSLATGLRGDVCDG